MYSLTINHSSPSERFQSFIRFFLYVLILLPSINFSLTTAEIFPYGILLFLFYGFRLKFEQLPLVFGLFISYLWGVWVWQAWNVDFIRSSLAYLNAFLAFYVILSLAPNRLCLFRHCLKTVFIGLIVLGILQVTGLASKLGFGYLLDILMRRGAEGALGSGRGVSLLSSEPSRAAYEVIFMYAALRATSFTRTAKYWLISDLLMTIFLAVVVRSATGMAFWLVYLVGVYRWLIVLPGFIISLAGVAWLSQVESRAIILILDVLSQSSLTDTASLLLNASGFRGISVAGAYAYVFHNLMGAGVGFWQFASVEAMTLTGIDPKTVSFFSTHNNGVYFPVRVTSYIASFIMDVGVLGAFCLICIFKRILAMLKVKTVFALALLFAFYLFVLSAIGNPVPWACFAFVYATYKYDKNTKKKLLH